MLITRTRRRKIENEHLLKKRLLKISHKMIERKLFISLLVFELPGLIKVRNLWLYNFDI